MKKLILILILLSISLYSQDNEPSPWEFEWGYSTTPRVFEPDSFQQNSVMTGFQWSGSWQMNNALLNNAAASAVLNTVSGTLNQKLNLIYKPTWRGRNYYVGGYFNSPFMQYEPTLPLDGTNEGTILRPDDITDPVFGFRNRKGRIPTISTDPNYSRIILEKDSSFVGGRVLDDIWPQPNFKTKTWDKYKADGETDNYLGRRWYLTINLKRLNPAIEIVKDDSVVISLKMPYTKWNDDTGYIKFNKLPIYHRDSTEKLDTIGMGERGYSQNFEGISPVDSLKITREILPISSDGHESITISAEFVTNGNEDDFNPIFSRSSLTSEEIKDLDIEVNYFGRTDIAIDYIRIESEMSHYLLRGELDSLEDDAGDYSNGRGHLDKYTDPDDPTHYDQPNAIYGILQTSIDAIRDSSNNFQDANLFRFYFQDTENDSYYWWGPMRYANKLSNGMFITRDGLKNPNLYYYYTESSFKWPGVGLTNGYLVPAPYARNGRDGVGGMNIKSGYLKSWNNIYYPDTLSSDYEILLDSGIVWSDMADDTKYNLQVNNSVVFQARYESEMYKSYFNEDSKLSSFLYNDNSWFFWNSIYNLTVQHFDNGTTIDTFIVTGAARHYTAEEFRLMNMGALIKGCKGFMTDGDQNRRLPYSSVGNMGLGDFTKLNVNNDIYSDSVGTDFINYKYNTWSFYNDTIGYKYFHPNLASKMEVDSDRVYIGTMSYRAELYEMNSFIRANDELLMNLRLCAAYSKGFRPYYSQNEELYGTDTLLHKFVNMAEYNTFTTRLVKKKLFDNHLEEPYDSSFFDITILREKDVPIDSVFYVGVQNRRTDPLIQFTNPLNSSEKYIRFLSSAEFRDSCINSPDSLLYQDYWWKRIGARKVTIPFDYTYSDTNDYNLLRISEIGSDVDSLNSLWHRGEKYYDMVTDTVIGQDRSLSFNLLPGQAKILRVEVLKTDMVSGFLDNYNQNNLIEYTDPLDTNKIIYHLAYYKNSYKPDTNIIYKEVHYIRVFQFKKMTCQKILNGMQVHE